MDYYLKSEKSRGEGRKKPWMEKEKTGSTKQQPLLQQKQKQKQKMQWIEKHKIRGAEEETEFVYLVFRQHLCRINLTQLSRCPEIPPPAVETVLFFPAKHLPVGMGAFCYESKLHLIGGEKLRKGKSLEFRTRFNPPNLLQSLNTRVFTINPDVGIPFVSSIPPMVGPKTGAKAVIVDDKIYVFTAAQYCLREVVPNPRFECYDPSKNKWEELPNPPVYPKEWPLFGLHISVMGRVIFVGSEVGYYYYYVDLKKWENASEYASLQPDPFNFAGSIAEYEGHGIFIAYTVEGLVAYRDATLTHHQQILPHLNDSVFPYADPGEQMAYIRYLGGGRFCFVLSVVCGHTYGRDIHLTIFRVEMCSSSSSSQTSSAGPESDFLDAVLLSHRVYDGDSACSFDSYHPTDVFTMCERSKKHGFYCFGDDQSFKKERTT